MIEACVLTEKNNFYKCGGGGGVTAITDNCAVKGVKNRGKLADVLYAEHNRFWVLKFWGVKTHEAVILNLIILDD